MRPFIGRVPGSSFILRRPSCCISFALALRETYRILRDPDLDREVKWHCKYARQNGIHVSPTFVIDGPVQADMSNGDPVGDWVSRLLRH